MGDQSYGLSKESYYQDLDPVRYLSKGIEVYLHLCVLLCVPK